VNPAPMEVRIPKGRNHAGGGLTFVCRAAEGADTKGQYYVTPALPVKPAEIAR